MLEAELNRDAFWGLAAGLVTTFAVLTIWLRYGRSEAENEHLRGVTLTDAKTLARLIRRRGEASRITLGGVPLRRASEMYGVLLMGAVGAGKTLGIREQLDVIREERKRAIVYDPTGELIATYFRDGRDNSPEPPRRPLAVLAAVGGTHPAASRCSGCRRLRRNACTALSPMQR